MDFLDLHSRYIQGEKNDAKTFACVQNRLKLGFKYVRVFYRNECPVALTELRGVGGNLRRGTDPLIAL